jgi:hypothetical protein
VDAVAHRVRVSEVRSDEVGLRAVLVHPTQVADAPDMITMRGLSAVGSRLEVVGGRA